MGWWQVHQERDVLKCEHGHVGCQHSVSSLCWATQLQGVGWLAIEADNDPMAFIGDLYPEPNPCCNADPICFRHNCFSKQTDGDGSSSKSE